MLFLFANKRPRIILTVLSDVQDPSSLCDEKTEQLLLSAVFLSFERRRLFLCVVGNIFVVLQFGSVH